jgi:hypothetical protein
MISATAMRVQASAVIMDPHAPRDVTVEHGGRPGRCAGTAESPIPAVVTQWW